MTIFPSAGSTATEYVSFGYGRVRTRHTNESGVSCDRVNDGFAVDSTSVAVSALNLRGGSPTRYSHSESFPSTVLERRMRTSSSSVLRSNSSTISPPSSNVVCTLRRVPVFTDVLCPPLRNILARSGRAGQTDAQTRRREKVPCSVPSESNARRNDPARKLGTPDWRVATGYSRFSGHAHFERLSPRLGDKARRSAAAAVDGPPAVLSPRWRLLGGCTSPSARTTGR